MASRGKFVELRAGRAYVTSNPVKSVDQPSPTVELGLAVPKFGSEATEHLFMVLLGMWTYVTYEIDDVRWIIEAHARSGEESLETWGPRATAGI